MKYQSKQHSFESIMESSRSEEKKRKSVKPEKLKRKSKGLINKRSYKTSPPSTSTFRVIEKYLGQKIDKAFNYEKIKYEDRSHPYVFVVMRNAVRKELKDIESIVSWYREEYKRFLIPDQEIFSHKKWILENKKIQENLSIKRNRHLLPLMNYLCNHKLSLKASESLADYINTGSFYKKTAKGEDRRYTFILIKPDYEDIEDKLGISRTLIQKYLKGMGDAGLIKSIRKENSHGKIVYALGYYLPYEGEGGSSRHKSIWFLKSSTEMKQALRDFYRPD